MGVEHMNKKCSTVTCDNISVERVYWPGKSPPPEYCAECAKGAKGIAEAMGFTLHTEMTQLPIDPKP